MTTTTHRPLLFMFAGFCRDWKPMAGFEDQTPTGKVCEFRSIPGNLVAWAESPDEAVFNLQRTLEKAFARAGSPQEWYERVVNTMSDKDWDDFNYFMKRVVVEGVEMERTVAKLPMKTNALLASVNARFVEVPYEFATVVEDESTRAKNSPELVTSEG